MLRLAGWFKYGHATASLLVGKLSGQLAAERAGCGVEGVGFGSAHDLRLPLVRPDLPSQDRPAAD